MKCRMLKKPRGIQKTVFLIPYLFDEVFIKSVVLLSDYCVKYETVFAD